MENYNNLIELAKETNDFIYELQSHKEVEQSKKLACKKFLNLLNESFSEEKAADALKQVI